MHHALRILPLLACLAACTPQEGLPPGAADAPDTVPAEARAPFSLAQELPIAARACIASETEGPQALQRLLSQGYVLQSGLGGTGYARMEPLSGKGVFDKVNYLSVRDPNGPVPCTIQIGPRDQGRLGLIAALEAGEAEGLIPITGPDGSIRGMTGPKGRFVLDAGYRHTEVFATLTIRRLGPPCPAGQDALRC